MRRANKARGEVALTLGGVGVILCATMENLGHFNEAIGTRDIQEAMAAMGARDPKLTGAIIEALAIEGDAKKAWAAARGVVDMTNACKAINAALFPGDDEGDEGNAKAGAGKG